MTLGMPFAEQPPALRQRFEVRGSSARPDRSLGRDAARRRYSVRSSGSFRLDTVAHVVPRRGETSSELCSVTTP